MHKVVTSNGKVAHFADIAGAQNYARQTYGILHPQPMPAGYLTPVKLPECTEHCWGSRHIHRRR